jgi:hypothetical protein
VSTGDACGNNPQSKDQNLDPEISVHGVALLGVA